MGQSWAGPSGGEFAALVRQRLGKTEGLQIDIDAGMPPGMFHVNVSWPAEETGVLCEVVDWVAGVRIMDPNGEDVPVDVALEYLTARADGHSAKSAWRFINRR